MKTKIEYLSI